jgi:hypothetical protein
MSYETDPKYFKFTKPDTWTSLPMYQKIAYYKTVLNQYYSPYVDKLIAKKIVKDLCGEDIKVAKVVRILNGPNDLTQRDLNPEHIIKSSHGSGWNINITPNINLISYKQQLVGWNIPYSSIHNEEQYKYISPRFFIEEKINDKLHGKNGTADLFSFRCLNGSPISIHIKRLGLINKYDIDFNSLEIPQFNLERPVELDKMIELSKHLSKPFEFVRIDFHLDKNSDIYFSEFTFTPNAGYQFFPMDVEERLGLLWK